MKLRIILLAAVVIILTLQSSLILASTTITLDDADGAILEDTRAESEFPDNTFGNSVIMVVDGGFNEFEPIYSFIKVDIGSIIDDDVEIISSTLQLHGSGGFGTINVTVYNSSNSTWNEDEVTWNNQPIRDTLISDALVTGTSEYKNFDVTDWVNISYLSGLSNVSFILTNYTHGANNINFRSKEHSTTTTRPRLIINYSAATPIIGDVSIIPSYIARGDIINCTAIYRSSVSGGKLEFQWFKNGELDTSLNGNSTSLNEDETGFTNNTFTITESGDSWICSGRAFNTTSFSDWSNSSSYYINEFPEMISNSTSIPSAYSVTPSWFNVTWIDDLDTEGFNHSLIELNGVNYSTSRDGNVSYYDVVLSSGFYEWRFFANDSNNSFGSTQLWSVTIDNGSNACHINLSTSSVVTDQDISIDSSTSVEAEAFCDSGVVSLFYNNQSVSSPETKTHGVGTHIYLANSSGNANYTGNSTGISVTLSVTAPTSSGGGGGGSPVFNIIEKNGTPLLFFDVANPFSFTVFYTPTVKTQKVLINNEGSLDFDGQIVIGESIKPYITTKLCSLATGECNAASNIKIPSGDRSLMEITLAAEEPGFAKEPIEGIISLESEDRTQQLGIIIERLPLLGQLQLWFAQTDLKGIGGNEKNSLFLAVVTLISGVMLVAFGTKAVAGA